MVVAQAMLPDGTAKIIEVEHLSYGGNAKGAAFATQDWFFAIEMDMS